MIGGMTMNKIYLILKRRRFQVLTVLISAIIFSICVYAYLDSQNHIYVSFIESLIGNGVYEVKDNNYHIFDEKYQNAIDEQIDELTKNASIEQPVLVYNPYGTNYNAINIYFGSSVEQIEYQIEVEGY